jgi:DNA-binding CsgD family transcriptional regulator
MNHLFLLLDILFLLVGFSTLVAFTFLMVQAKDKLIVSVWFFLGAFTLDMLFNTGYFYLYQNVGDFFSEYAKELFYIQITIGSLLIFSIPNFIIHLIPSRFQSGLIYLFMLVPICQWIGSVLYSERAGVIYRITILSTILFTLVYTAVFFRKIENKANKKLIVRIMVLALVAFLMNLSQMFQLKALFRVSIPILYVAFCLVFFLHFIENYFRSDQFQEKTDQNLERFDFTKREKEVVELVLKGFTNKKIAQELHVSLSTIKSHILNSFQKAEVSSRFELAHLLKFKELDGQ